MFLLILYLRAGAALHHENAEKLNAYEVKILKSIHAQRLHWGTANQQRFIERIESKLIS
jgi:hypothetical protein